MVAAGALHRHWRANQPLGWAPVRWRLNGSAISSGRPIPYFACQIPAPPPFAVFRASADGINAGFCLLSII